MFQPLGNGLIQTTERVKRWQDSEGQPTGILTGLSGWDDATGGFEPTDLTILGGRPGMGKSALALNIAGRVAANTGTVLLVSTEMPADLVRRRLASIRSGISDHRLRTGNGSEQEYRRFVENLQLVCELPILVCDTPGVWTDRPEQPYADDTIAGGLRKMLPDHKPALVIVDHLSRLGDNPTEAPNYRVGGIARRLKNLAMESGVPVLALAQLNRQVEYRDDKRPRLSDLRDSGEIEAEADIVALMYRQDYYLQPNMVGYDRRLAGKCLIEIAKHRSGPTTAFTLSFTGDTQRFS